LAAGSGWSWDSTQRYPTTATTGGSAKVQGGATRALYAQQSIDVAEGDKLVIHCYAKSSSSVSANSIKLDVVEIRGDGTTVERAIAAMGTSTNWVRLGNTEQSPYVVGSGVTSIRVKIGTTTGVASNRYVWFDAISVQKVGILSGDWVQGLLGTVTEDFLSTVRQVVEGILGSVPGVTLDDNSGFSIAGAFTSFFQTLFGPLVQFLPPSIASSPLLEAAIPGLSGDKITSGAVSADFLPISDIGDELGTAITSGSGGKMSRRSTLTVQAASGNSKFSTFFQNSSNTAGQVDQKSADMTASFVPARWTVTYAGYYIVELGFTVNASVPTSGAFNVAPAIYVNGSATPYKVGADSLGSYGEFFFGTAGNWSRSAHSTFIVYLPAGGSVDAGYVNYGATNNSFFTGDTAGNSTYFSIAMLNRTAEG